MVLTLVENSKFLCTCAIYVQRELFSYQVYRFPTMSLHSSIYDIYTHQINSYILYVQLTYMSVFVLKTRSLIASGAIQRIGNFPSVLL